MYNSSRLWENDPYIYFFILTLFFHHLFICLLTLFVDLFICSFFICFPDGHIEQQHRVFEQVTVRYLWFLPVRNLNRRTRFSFGVPD